VIEVRQTETYAAWFANLRDTQSWDIVTALELAREL
jgi:hypothetical protein